MGEHRITGHRTSRFDQQTHRRRSLRFLLLAILGISTAVTLAAVAMATTTKTAVKPSVTQPPTISGSASEGNTLTADHGNWDGSQPISYAYSWQRCDKDGGSCSAISGATQQTYTLKAVDNGNTLRVRATATNADGSSSATSVPTAVVSPAATTTTTTTTATTTTTPPPASNGCATSGGTVAIAGITPPARLNIDQFQVSPATITYGTRSLTARFHVSACGGSVQGALVLVTAVPYGMFALPNEQTTGADGWASLTFTALSGFPVSQKQQLLVMFVRARKSGEDILGGISSRRLVSFKVTHG
jgi:hypothetical protein